MWLGRREGEGSRGREGREGQEREGRSMGGQKEDATHSMFCKASRTSVKAEQSKGEKKGFRERMLATEGEGEVKEERKSGRTKVIHISAKYVLVSHVEPSQTATGVPTCRH